MAAKKKSLEDYEAESQRVGECLIHPAAPVRHIYEMRHGRIGDSNIAVCHTCDNEYCIEDSHHFLGTWKVNIDDSVAKGRHSCFQNVKKALAAAHAPEVLQHPERKRKISVAITKRWELCRSLGLRDLHELSEWENAHN